MNQPSLKLCPKCGKPFIRIAVFSPTYDIYVHKQKEGAKGLRALIKYCIVAKDYVYNHPEPDVTGKPLNPGYRTLKP